MSASDGHFISWYTRHGDAAETKLSPFVTDFICDAVHLTVSTCEAGTLTLFTKVNESLGGLGEVNLNAVEAVLDDLNGHWSGLFDVLSIGHTSGDGGQSGQIGNCPKASRSLAI